MRSKYESVEPQPAGRVAALVRSHMNGLIPFERTIEQTTETIRFLSRLLPLSFFHKCFPAEHL